MHIERIPGRIWVARFNLVTSDKQVGFDVNKICCAHGCMSLIGKSKLRELRRFYFRKTLTSAHICKWCQTKHRGSKCHSSIIFTMRNKYLEWHSKLRYVLVTCG